MRGQLKRDLAQAGGELINSEIFVRLGGLGPFHFNFFHPGGRGALFCPFDKSLDIFFCGMRTKKYSLHFAGDYEGSLFERGWGHEREERNSERRSVGQSRGNEGGPSVGTSAGQCGQDWCVELERKKARNSRRDPRPIKLFKL